MADPTTETAKAVQEAAKLGRKALETGEKASSFLSKYFDGGLAEIGNSFSDWAKGWRARNFIKIMEKTERAISDSDLDLDRLVRISERNAIPLISALSQESDNTLQDMWARFLRNGLDPSRNSEGGISRLLIDVISKLEPADAQVLQSLFSLDLEEKRHDPVWLKVSDLTELSEDQSSHIFNRLAALGLITFSTQKGSTWAPGKHETAICHFVINTSAGHYRTNSLLLELKRATS